MVTLVRNFIDTWNSAIDNNNNTDYPVTLVKFNYV